MLQSGEDVEARTEYWVWLPVLVELLAEHDDVRIVVHSSWRYERTLAELREVLGALGSPVIDLTPRTSRWESIEWWMSQNFCAVSSCYVLDDSPHQFPSPPPLQLVICDPRCGVSAPDVQAALREWLGEEESA